MLLVLLAGGCMQFAYSPWDFRWLVLLLLVVFVACLRLASPWRIGWCFGLGWFGLGGWWLAPMFEHYGHLPWVVAIACVVLIGLCMGAFVALWSALAVRWGGRDAGLLIVLPALAVIEEWLRGHMFTGLPWGALGQLLLDTPAVGWVSVLGMYGVSFFPVLIATALALLIFSEQQKIAASALLGCLLLVFLAPSLEGAEGLEKRARLVQPDIPQDVKWEPAFVDETMNRLIRLSYTSPEKVDLIVWPEAAVPFFLERSPGWDAWLKDWFAQGQTPVLFGGVRLLELADMSSHAPAAQTGMFLAHPDGQREFAGKHHLVPFGEYVPGWLPWVKTLVPEVADFQPATDGGIVSLPDQRLGSLVCYESIFPEETRQRVAAGAQVLVVITNDAWYGHSPAAWQHLQAARMRAVESGRYVLRAANTGVTAVIAADGRVTASVPWWSEQSLMASYRLSDRQTVYQQWGDWPALLLAGMMLLVMGARRWRKS